MPWNPRAEDDLRHFERQLILPEIGPTGQAALAHSTVAVVGVGGLGCPAALYLAAAGVGTLKLIDGDVVEASNLHRQVLYGPADIGRAKATAAAAFLQSRYPHTEVQGLGHRIEDLPVEDLGGCDVVLDCTDNFPTRFWLNDACWGRGIPLVHGALSRFGGLLTAFVPGQGPCYRCFFAEPPTTGAVPGCGEAGVLGAAVGTVGTMQALEAIKLLVGAPKTLVGTMLVLDLWGAGFDRIALAADPACGLCAPIALGGAA